MTLEFLTFLTIGAFAAGFINGLAGFGTSLFALGWWLQVMSPAQSVAAILVVSVFSSIQGVVHVRKSIELRRLAIFLIPALFGIPLGLQILQHIDADLLKLVIAVFMLVYGGFFVLRRDLPNISANTPVIDALIGFVSGVLGAVAGLSGALPTIWLSMRDWAKEKSRAILQPFNTVVLSVAAALLALDGAYDRETLIVLAIAVPVSLIAAQIGLMVFKRLTNPQFRRLLIIMMFVSGALLLAAELI